VKALAVAAGLAVSTTGCALYNGIAGVCDGDGYTTSVERTIPDNDDNGVTSSISVPLTGRPDGIGIELDIEHGFESDLQIRLIHGNLQLEIEDLGDHGPFHQFDEVDVGGPWIVNVADTLSSDIGYWTEWTITICGE
jgi:subtilisin-like proprotein convertase family protein